MPSANSSEPSYHSGIRVGDVGGDVRFTALGDIVGGDKIVNFTTTIQISAEVIAARPLIVTSPYRGLDPFKDADRELFFGRDQLIKTLLEKLSSSPILLLLGSSGSGKSSVVRAGVLPTLAKLFGSRCKYFVFVPDVDPFESLRSSFINSGFSQSEANRLRVHDPDTVLQFIRSLKRSEDQWVLFIDQFEEVFTQTDESLRIRFIEALTAVCRDPTGSIKVILAMRADFLERLSPFPDFTRRVEKNIELLTDMHVDELRLAIEQPAGQHGVVFQSGLVEEIIKDVQGQAGSLPLLQYTLNLLWEHEKEHDGLADRTLNTMSYRQLGGVRGALQKRADEIYASFGEDSDPKSRSPRQEIIRQIFIRLVDVATIEGSVDVPWQPVRRRVPIESFRTVQERHILMELIKQKLLVGDRAGAGTTNPESTVVPQEATVEVAHEALFTCWELLKNWIAAAKRVIFVRNRLTDDCLRWLRIRDTRTELADDELWTGSRLDEALSLRAGNDFAIVLGGLNEEEDRFLDLSSVLRDKRQREEEQQRLHKLEVAQKLALAEAERAAEAERRVEEQQRATSKLRRRATITAVMALVALLLFGMSVMLLGWTRDEAKRAADARDQGDGLINFMLFNLLDKLQPVELNIFKDVTDKAKEYLTARPLNELSESRRKLLVIALQNLGDVLTLQEKRAEALQTYDHSLSILNDLTSRNKSDVEMQNILLTLYNKIGDVLAEDHKLDDALKQYLESLRIGQSILQSQPSEQRWLLNVAFSYNKIGDALLGQSKLDEALTYYELSQKISNQIASQWRGNAVAQECQALSFEKLGDLLLAKGNLDEASREYNQSRELREKLVQTAPLDNSRQRALSSIYDKLGNVSAVKNQFEDSLEMYRQSLDIRKHLVERAPLDKRRRREVSVSYEHIGDTLNAAGRFDDSIVNYQQVWDILERLDALREAIPHREVDWIRGYRISPSPKLEAANPLPSTSLAKSTLGLGHFSNPLEEWDTRNNKSPFEKWREMEDIFAKWDDPYDSKRAVEQLAKNYLSSESEWRAKLWLLNPYVNLGDDSDLDDAKKEYLRVRTESIKYEAQGDVLSQNGEIEMAIDNYQKSIDLRKRMIEQDRSNISWQCELAINYGKLGDAYVDQRKSEGLLYYIKSLKIGEEFKPFRSGPRRAGVSKVSRVMVVAYYKIGVFFATARLTDAAMKMFQQGLAALDLYAGSDREVLKNRFDQELQGLR